MKKTLIFLIFIFSIPIFSQVDLIEVKSKILNQTRQIKVQLPRNYKENKDKSYPVVMVFDADYLFEPVAGMVDFYSYWEYIPEAIIVGINQADFRKKDGFIDKDSQVPIETGANFYDFITQEVLTFIDKNYRTSPFIVITAQDFMANFASFFLMKENPVFRGYINLSPDFTSLVPDRLVTALEQSEDRIWYYLSTSENDLENLKSNIVSANKSFKSIENKNFYYYFDNFENQDHFSQVGLGLSNAFQQIFSLFKPISDDEYTNQVLKADNYVDYLISKYDDIAELYAIDIDMRTSDFFYINDAIEKNEAWDQFKALSKLAEKQFPKTLLPYYFIARYYQEIGKPKKAMEAYRSAFGLEEVGFITNDLMINKADEIKEIFGY